jgi:hypothetical protein
VYETLTVPGTAVRWRQAAKILPADPAAREAILAIEAGFERISRSRLDGVAHVPSRVRSILWLAAAQSVLAAAGHDMPTLDSIMSCLAGKVTPGSACGELAESLPFELGGATPCLLGETA